jgi:hypothetical protein
MENHSGVSLKEYLESRISSVKESSEIRIGALEKQVLAAMDASEKAVTKAELAAEKRFESVNEFRGSLDDSNKLMATRTEVDEKFGFINEKVERLTKELDSERYMSKGRSDVWGWIGGGVVGLIVALLLMFVQGTMTTNPKEVPREIIREVPIEEER